MCLGRLRLRICSENDGMPDRSVEMVSKNGILRVIASGFESRLDLEDLKRLG